MLHDEDCAKLSTTADWVPFDVVSGASVEGLEIQSCPGCLQ